MIPVSPRLLGVNASQTIAAHARMARLKAEGRDVVALTSGTPDLDTPEPIKQAAIRAMLRGETKQTDVAGTLALRRAVIAKFRRDSGIAYGLDEVMVSTGSKQVLFNAILATVGPGDEAVIPAPCWVSYPDIVQLAEGRPVMVPCDPAHGFKLRPEALEAAITPRTRWLIINNPCNPTGAVYTASDLRPLCDVLLRYPQVLVLTDDIYEKVTYGPRAATFVEVEPRLRDRTVTMNGCSKAYAMTGWRLGFCGAPAPLVAEMAKIQSQSTSSTCSIAQAAAIEALAGPQDFVARAVEDYRGRRDLGLSILAGTPGLDCAVPEGALYLFPSVAGCFGKVAGDGTLVTDDESFVDALVAEEGVGVVAGTAFMYPGHVRISFANSRASVEEGCRRIRRFCDKLSRA